MLEVWAKKSGFNLGTYQERIRLEIPLPVINTNNIKFRIISGKIPPGLRLKGHSLIGVPLEVSKETVFEFCIRASLEKNFADRTYKITIQGADVPVIIDPPDLLPVGPNSTYFILDSSPVDFQITATDFDMAAGQQLKYFIDNSEGTLPPGLTMDDNGHITGFIDPLLSIKLLDRNGSYDKASYDQQGFDYGIKSDNGYDSFKFDTSTYDYFLPSIGPKKLNRNYEFIVTVSDGDTLVKRRFRIYVISEDFLRADNSIMSAANSSYTADGSGVRAPIWYTKPNLGIIRTNNYSIIKLDVYNTLNLGEILYQLEKYNPDNSESKLPPGMKLDTYNGEIFGLIPYQSDVIKTYNFTITATRYGRKGEESPNKRTFTIKLLSNVNSIMSWTSSNYLGMIDANNISTLKIQAVSTLDNAVVSYRLISGQLPPGLSLDLKGEIIGKVEQYGNGDSIKGLTTFDNASFTLDEKETTMDRRYKFTIRAQDQIYYSAIDKEFEIMVNTPNTALYSNIFITSYLDPFTPTPKTSKRSLYEKFLNDETVFIRNYIYRINDPNFGIIRNFRALLYAGIETKQANAYISAIGFNNKKKRFQFGSVKLAQAKDPDTGTHIYDIVYVELIDPLDIPNKKIPVNLKKIVKISPTITVDKSFTVDRSTLLSGGSNSRVNYLNNYLNWREKLKTWKDTDILNPNRILDQFLTEYTYLPLWMRSFQDDTKQELGFVLALPLCYCKPGYGKEIVLNIKNYQMTTNFDFKDLDFNVDRYIIDSVIPNKDQVNYGDKYLVFRNNEVIL
jgi:hypothetical protein